MADKKAFEAKDTCGSAKGEQNVDFAKICISDNF